MIPGASTNCKMDPKYRLDTAMEELVIRKLNCNIPWSLAKVEGLEDCTNFEEYFKINIESQNEIIKLPRKCEHGVWTAQHYDEVLYNGTNEIEVGLMASTKKVPKLF